MRDHQQAGRAAEGAIEGAAEIVRIQGSEAFVQDDQVGALEQCPGDEETASLAVGKLPTGLSHHLLQTPRHPLQKLAQSELPANLFRVIQICGPSRPASAHQEIEGEGLREDVILVELRGGGYAP